MRSESRLRGADPATGARELRYLPDLAARLTLVYLLLKPIGEWWIQVPVVALAAFGVLFPRALRHPALWWGLTGLSVLRVLHGWTWMDNHAYLLTYWLLALALFRTFEEPDEELATNARYLIAAAFGFAVLWKAGLTTDFVSGDFFHATFLIDARFRDLVLLADLASPAQWQANMDAIAALLRGEVAVVELASTPRLPRFVQITTWWTVLLESAVAVTFAMPVRWGISRAKDPLLLLFAWSTYPFATVAGFGWLLMILGLAQAPRSDRTLHVLYLVSFVAILVMRDAPWTSAIFAFR